MMTSPSAFCFPTVAIMVASTVPEMQQKAKISTRNEQDKQNKLGKAIHAKQSNKQKLKHSESEKKEVTEKIGGLL